MTKTHALPCSYGGELVTALHVNDADLFKCWLSGGMQDLGEPMVVKLLLDWLDPFLTLEEENRWLGSHPGVNPLVLMSERR